ncbi:MAG: hypothetical protein ACKOX6_00105 [Bdellovibrio sp.]
MPLIGPSRRRRAPTQAPNSKLNELFKNHNLVFSQTGFQGGPSRRRKGHRLALWSWLASMIDGLLLLAASCLFLICFSLIVKSPAGAVLSEMFHTQIKGLFFLEIFAASSWIYLITTRIFMGSSVGEWACDLRLGQPQERLASAYAVRVVLRCTLILATGVVTLPILSLLSGKDLAGVLSGLRLFSLK